MLYASRTFAAATLLAVVLPLAHESAHAQAQGAAVTGRYRNLFVEAGRTPAQVSAKIQAAFQQLFHGDSVTQTVYYRAGQNANGPLAYVTDINNHDVRTEGMSYGMMIAVQLDKKAEFDALWNWSKTYMYHDRYYDGLWYLMALMHDGGEFRVWTPRWAR